MPEVSSAPRPKKVVIVGAGPGGLASALLLAAEGVEVQLFERETGVGGRTKTFATPQGYRFDVGPTFFLYPKALARIFEACGERLEDHVELKRLDPQYRVIFEGGGEIRASSDLEKLTAEIARISPDDARNVRPFFEHGFAKLKLLEPALERAFDSWRSLVCWEMVGALPKLQPMTTVDGELRRFFKDPRVRLAFSFQTKYIGMSPFKCPSLFSILCFMEYGHGVYHPVGGCGAVMEAMAALARRMGVDIRLGAAVDEVIYEEGEARGVRVAGREVRADAVVVNADFSHAMPKLVPEAARPRWRDRKIGKARLSCSTFMLYLGIEGELPPEVAHHNILLARDYARNIREVSTGVLSHEPSIYVQHAGHTDGAMAPPGGTSLYVLAPVPNLRAGINWEAEQGRFRDRVLDRLTLMGLPDIRERIRYERIIDPRDWRDQFSVHQGATFNLSHDLRQMLFFRPHNRFGHGLYLVGGGTHPGSGLPVIFEGARITSRLLMEDLAKAPETPRRPARRTPAPARGGEVGRVPVLSREIAAQGTTQ